MIKIVTVREAGWIERISFNDVLLSPQYSEVRSRNDVSLVTELSSGLKLDIPIIASNMDTVCGPAMLTAISDLGGIGVYPRGVQAGHRISLIRQTVEEGRKVAVAVGVNSLLKEIGYYADVGVSAIVLDIAHGDSAHALEKIVQIRRIVERRNPNVCVIGGNVATAGAVKRMAEAGAHCVKVGIGGGSACTTRVNTGVGVPTLSSIMDCATEADKHGIFSIADGGIKTPGDVAKALAAGADAVMLGGMLAGTDESPGGVVLINGQQFKNFRGNASAEAGSKYVEGGAGLVPHTGPLRNIIESIENGLKSAFSYTGARNIEEFHAKAKFVRVSAMSVMENGAHGLSHERKYDPQIGVRKILP